MKSLTREQRVALLSVYHRDWGKFEKPSYMQWRRNARRMRGDDRCILVKWCDMWIGVSDTAHMFRCVSRCHCGKLTFSIA